MKPSVILFGAGGAGLIALEALRSRVRVSAFADNDPKKHGTTIAGLPVIPPATIPQLTFDGVVISSMYAEEIHAQLLRLGVAPELIHVYGTHRTTARPLFPWDAVLFLGAAALTGLLLIVSMIVLLCVG